MAPEGSEIGENFDPGAKHQSETLTDLSSRKTGAKNDIVDEWGGLRFCTAARMTLYLDRDPSGKRISAAIDIEGPDLFKPFDMRTANQTNRAGQGAAACNDVQIGFLESVAQGSKAMLESVGLKFGRCSRTGTYAI